MFLAPPTAPQGLQDHLRALTLPMTPLTMPLTVLRRAHSAAPGGLGCSGDETEMITGIIGVLGVLVGIFAERLAQRYGRLRCEAENVRLQIIGAWDGLNLIHALPVDPGRLEPSDEKSPLWVDYRVAIELFNEKELRTGLRALEIVFRGQDGTCLKTIPHDHTSWRLEHRMPTTDALEVVNLPSREWVRLDLSGGWGSRQANSLRRARR